MILNVLNYDMTDIFAQLGVDTRGGEFVYAETEKTTPHDRQQALRTLMVDLGMPVDPDVIYETFGIEKPAGRRYIQLQYPMQNDNEDPAEDLDDSKPTGQKVQNKGRSFFVQAPPRGAQDLDW